MSVSKLVYITGLTGFSYVCVCVCVYIYIYIYIYRYGLARYESIMGLRDSLEEFGRMKGAKTDEKGKLLTLISSHHHHHHYYYYYYFRS